MAFISATDFIDKPYQVPNQEESREFVAFIEDQETKLLKELLGLDLYNDFIAGLEESGDIERWTNLRDGAEYQFNSRTNEYTGIVKMIKPAIYSLWIPIVHRRLTTSGVVTFNGIQTSNGQQNTTVINPDYEIVKNWNEYVNLAGPEFSQSNSLYGFLQANIEDYEGLHFCPPKHQNQFNL